MNNDTPPLPKPQLVKPIKHIEPEPIKVDVVEGMIYVESRGNDSAYNASEDAVGCLQIRPIMVREVNRILRKQNDTLRFELEDRWDRNKSLEMFHIWRGYYHPNSNWETIARCWNGGPSGHKTSRTHCYWNKVRKELDLLAYYH